VLAVWSAAERGRPGPTLAHAIARELAASPEPMTRTESADRLDAPVASRGHQAVMADLKVTLNRHQAFCRVTRHHWQARKGGRLGRRLRDPSPALAAAEPDGSRRTLSPRGIATGSRALCAGGVRRNRAAQVAEQRSFHRSDNLIGHTRV
jgi:hypothetical protein